MEDTKAVMEETIKVNGPNEEMIQFRKELNELAVEIDRFLDGKTNIEKVASEYADVKFCSAVAESILNAVSNNAFTQIVEVEFGYKTQRQHVRNVQKSEAIAKQKAEQEMKANANVEAKDNGN